MRVNVLPGKISFDKECRIENIGMMKNMSKMMGLVRMNEMYIRPQAELLAKIIFSFYCQ